LSNSIKSITSDLLSAESISRNVLPWAHLSPEPSWQKVPILYNGSPFPPKIAIPMDPVCYMVSWAHPSPKPKWHLNLFSHYCTDDCRVSLCFTMGSPFLPQNCLFPWGSGPPSKLWFPGPTRVLNPNSISIGSAVFAGLTSVTD